MSLNREAQRLLDACLAAYILHPRDCSAAVNEVLKRMADPAVTDPVTVRMDANTLIRFLSDVQHGWTEVGLAEGALLANQGQVVIGGATEPGGHGHVLIIMPGPLQESGGYLYKSRSGKYESKLSILLVGGA